MTKASHRTTRPRIQDFRREGGKWLRDRRILVGLSQRDLAELVGASPWTFISQVETGRSSIMPSNYLAWAAALKMSPQEFVREILQHYNPITYTILFGED